MRWLDALGPLKLPSLLLVGAPLAAYPFWLPEALPAEYCGEATVEGQAFTTYRLASGGYILRPLQSAAGEASPIQVRQPVGFDAGGMVVQAAVIEGTKLTCLSETAPRQHAAVARQRLRSVRTGKF